MTDSPEWEKIAIHFPESFEGLGGKEDYEEIFPEYPEIFNGSVRARLEEGYAINISFGGFPSWLERRGSLTGEIWKIYAEIAKSVYRDAVKDVEKVMHIIDSWRGLIKNLDGSNGHIESIIDFFREDSGVSMEDTYDFDLNSAEETLTDRLLYIKDHNIFKKVFNKEISRELEAAKWVAHSKGPYKPHRILGENLTECVRKADYIYSLAERIKKFSLEYPHGF